MQDLYTGRLLCSRICHDLVTPVGAVLSGLELLEEHPSGGDQEIIDLLRLSANECSRRLTLLRFCFGVGAASGLNSLNDIQATFQRSVDPNKFSFKLNLPDGYLVGQPQLRDWGQLLANLFSLGLEFLPYGGQIKIDATDDYNPQLQLVIKGQRVIVQEEVKNVVENGTDPESLTARTIQGYLIHQLATQLSRRIQIAQIGEDVYIKTQSA